MTNSIHRWIVLPLLLAIAAGAARAGCPDAPEVLRRVDGLALDHSSRAVRFDFHPRSELYAKAARKIGKTIFQRDGKKGYAVLVSETPLEPFWRAINDEARHAEYTPVKGSMVVDGTPRADDRLIFQYAKMFGLGRWWISRVRMNRELFRKSEGKIWESWWQDELESADPADTPFADVAAALEPIAMSRGSWLIADLDDGCTLIELFSWSEAGGFVGAFEGMAVERSMRATLDGMTRFARENLAVDRSEPPFRRPDGAALHPPLHIDESH